MAADEPATTRLVVGLLVGMLVGGLPGAARLVLDGGSVETLEDRQLEIRERLVRIETILDSLSEGLQRADFPPGSPPPGSR